MAASTPRPCSASTPATLENTPGRSAVMTVRVSSLPSSTCSPARIRARCSADGKSSRRTSSSRPPASTWRGALDELGDEARLPSAPRRRAGRQRVGLGERGEQLEGGLVADRLGDEVDRAGVVEVAAGGDVGQQQVVLDEGDERVDVAWREPHPRRRSPRTSSMPTAVWSPGAALADVVQQRADDEEVGPAARDSASAAAPTAASTRCRSTVKRW